MKKLIFISLCTASLGMLFYAWHKQWIVIKLPIMQEITSIEPIQSKSLKKNIMLHYWHTDAWHKEKSELLWQEDLSQNIQYLLNQWLSLLDEEQIMDKKVIIQSVLMSPSQYAYISFDRNPFDKEQKTIEKIYWIEGLLKTLRENGILTQGINFLVQHQPLCESHLDFSNPWPLSGFLTQ